jgi:ketosteroid isomerase-like protein
MSNQATSITREVYEAFQRNQLERFDAVVASDVVTNSPGGYGVKGREALKTWAGEFIKALKPRIDLVDEHDGTMNGEGRAFITVNLNWKHVEPFFDLRPTGREGTSVETFVFTIKGGKIIRWDVSDNTLDLALYLSQGGWPMSHNIQPEPLVRGIDRR